MCRENPVNPLDPDAGHNLYRVQTRPAQQFYGAPTVDETDSTVSYSVANHDYGRYLIKAVPVPIPLATKPSSGSYEVQNGQYVVPGHNEPAAMSLGQLANALLDPRFNDYLVLRTTL